MIGVVRSIESSERSALIYLGLRTFEPRGRKFAYRAGREPHCTLSLGPTYSPRARVAALLGKVTSRRERTSFLESLKFFARTNLTSVTHPLYDTHSWLLSSYRGK